MIVMTWKLTIRIIRTMRQNNERRRQRPTITKPEPGIVNTPTRTHTHAHTTSSHNNQSQQTIPTSNPPHKFTTLHPHRHRITLAPVPAQPTNQTTPTYRVLSQLHTTPIHISIPIPIPQKLISHSLDPNRPRVRPPSPTSALSPTMQPSQAVKKRGKASR